jgi:hypothetical protein
VVGVHLLLGKFPAPIVLGSLSHVKQVIPVMTPGVSKPLPEGVVYEAP